MTRDDLIAWATRNSWRLDRWGHLKRELDNGTHRLKLGHTGVRHELSTPFGWALIARRNYMDLQPTADGNLAGLEF
jgi:hypothetical protein